MKSKKEARQFKECICQNFTQNWPINNATLLASLAILQKKCKDDRDQFIRTGNYQQVCSLPIYSFVYLKTISQWMDDYADRPSLILNDSLINKPYQYWMYEFLNQVAYRRYFSNIMPITS